MILLALQDVARVCIEYNLTDLQLAQGLGTEMPAGKEVQCEELMSTCLTFGTQTTQVWANSHLGIS
eukprot:850608-Amphidinium_carterae.1